MAKITEQSKSLILADFHTGQFTQRKLAKKHKISVASINKIVGGMDAKHEQKVNTILTAHSELMGEDEQEVNAVQLVIDEQLKHIAFFKNSALQNQQYSNKVMKEKNSDMNILESHSRITQRNKETVLGKDKTTEITNTNAQQNITEIVISEA